MTASLRKSSSTRLSILPNLIPTLVWMVSILLLISSYFSWSLVTVTRVLSISGISFFISTVILRNNRVHLTSSLRFSAGSDLLVGMVWSVWISQFQITGTDSALWIYCSLTSQILISCTIICGSYFKPTPVKSCFHFVVVRSISLYKLFCLLPHRLHV